MGALICPKKVKVGEREMKVSSRGGHCWVKRADGSKAPVRKVERGHKGFGQFLPGKGKGKGPKRATRRELEARIAELMQALSAAQARSPRWEADRGYWS